MKLVLIVNNLGQSYDGIGAYAAVMKLHLPIDIQTKVYSGYCKDTTAKVLRFIHPGMTVAIARAVFNFRKDDADSYLVEYPFMEWNPLILPLLYLLSGKAKKNQKCFVVSLHEYGRANPLRKWVSKQICKMADLVFTTTDDIKRAIAGFCRRVELRNPPSSIWDNEAMSNPISKDRNCFAYFGLIVSSKAFDEMIAAWDCINADNQYELYIISATRLENDFPERHPGIRCIYNGDDATIIRILRKCAYCFLPIKPEIDMKNGTFKTVTAAGCICIGRFCKNLKDLPFVVQMENYEPKEFIRATQRIEGLSDEQILDMTGDAYDYGRQFDPAVAFQPLAKYLRNLVYEKRA